jgi:hypothetical protein
LKRNRLSIFGFILFTLLISIVSAQEASISIENIGFERTAQNPRISIYNTGEALISDVTIYVDGREIKTIQGLTSPGKGFITTLSLDPGEHLINVETAEGAFDSMEIKISAAKEKSSSSIEELAKTNPVWLAEIVLILVFLLVLGLYIKSQGKK